MRTLTVTVQAILYCGTISAAGINIIDVKFVKTLNSLVNRNLLHAYILLHVHAVLLLLLIH